jgi:hypothetical protein
MSSGIWFWHDDLADDWGMSQHLGNGMLGQEGRFYRRSAAGVSLLGRESADGGETNRRTSVLRVASNSIRIRQRKKPAEADFFSRSLSSRSAVNADRKGLLDLAFLVHDVLADDGIKFLDLHLAWLVALVLGRCIEVTGAGAGIQADLFACCLGHG